MTKAFKCDDPDLDEFLKKDALKYSDGCLAVTYLVLYNQKLMGFFCLSNDAIKVNEEDMKELDELDKHLPNYPALKIGRLGVCEEYRRKGVGTFIIKHVTGRAVVQSQEVGCRYVTVDSYNKADNVRFYEKNKFKALVDGKERKNVPMYYDILKI